MRLADRLPARFGPLAMVLAGAASALGFAPLDWWPVTLLALFLFISMVAMAARARDVAGSAWLFGLGHFVVGLNWIAGSFRYQEAMPAWFGWIGVVLLSLFFSLYPALAAALAVRITPRASTARIVALAGTWCMAEWLRATLLTGFAWNPLGTILVAPGLAGAAGWVGSYGLSALIVLGVGTAWLAVQRRARAAVGCGLAALSLIGIGIVRPPAMAVPPSQPLLQVVQPNIGQQDKWRKDYAAQNYARLAANSGTPGPVPRLILWPEAAVPDYPEDEETARVRLAGLLGPRDTLLLGATAIVWGKGDDVEAVRNSIFVLEASARLHGRYDKAHLVPFGEYLPLRPVLSAIGLSRLVPGDLDFLAGPGPRTIDVAGVGPVGMQLCYEIIFSGRVIDRAHRPLFLFNPSNDAWFGSWGPPQHLAQARLRAIEEGVPIVRSTPTGISALIDADGNVVRQLPYQRAGSFLAPIPAARAPTLFARFGNILPLGLATILIAFAIALGRRPQ